MSATELVLTEQKEQELLVLRALTDEDRAKDPQLTEGMIAYIRIQGEEIWIDAQDAERMRDTLTVILNPSGATA